MSDRDIVKKILKYVPKATFEFEEDNCVSAVLTKKDHIHFGLMRSLSLTDKKEVLNLLAKLKSIRVLDLRKNRIGLIPDLGLEMLEHIDLASNYMGQVPEWIKNKKLKFLNLGVNEIQELPEWINEFTNLEVLKLHKNKIKGFEEISECKKIKFLNLYLNHAKKVPKFIWNFLDVEFFSWGVSGTTRLSEDIINWKNLQWISLVHNKLDSLPESICKLTQLKGIRANKNKISKLPNEIGNLCNLRQLSLYKNELKNLPDSFRMLRLEKLNLSHNLFKDAPDVTADWLCSSPNDLKWR